MNAVFGVGAVWAAVAVLASSALAQAGQQPAGAAVNVTSDSTKNATNKYANSRELAAAQERQAFTVVDAIHYLAGEDEALARTAAAVVRHEWAVLPDEFFAGLDAHPLAAQRFLAELARAPRPAARDWVNAQVAPAYKRSYNHRLLALAARGEPLLVKDARLLLEAVAAIGEQPVRDGFYSAASHVPASVADGLIGRLHQMLLQASVPVEALGPLFDRLSPRGARALLGMAVTLPEGTARKLLRQVHDVWPELVLQRAATALDGKIPLHGLWFAYAGKLLNRPDRIERVLAVAVDGNTAQERDGAFELLLSARAIDERILRAVIDTESDARIRRVIAAAGNEVPESFVVAWLQHSPEVMEEMARALVRRPVLEPRVQKALLDILAGLDGADSHTPMHALTALVRGGDSSALAVVWPLLMNNSAWVDLLFRLGQRQEPFVYERLLVELIAGRDAVARAGDGQEDTRQEQLDMLRLLLVARGDRRELATLVRHAPHRNPDFVRRCRHYADKLSVQQACTLFDAALAAEDPDVGAELLEWVVATQPEAVGERLWQLWQDSSADAANPVPEELQVVAMRLLAAGPRRQSLIAELQAALTRGPLSGRLSALPYEVLNGMSDPLSAADALLCAQLVLRMPLADGDGERRRVGRWPDGSFGFPLVAAVANRLRHADARLVERVFTEVVDELIGDPRRVNISRQRLKVFWRSLALRRDLQRTLGSITAQLWVFDDGDEVVLDGAANWLLAARAERQKHFASAERLYRQAGRQFLRLPYAGVGARWLLGDRDPAAGSDPLAALAAAPYRMRLLAARQAGDPVAIANARKMVREFVGYDRETLTTSTDTPEESGR